MLVNHSKRGKVTVNEPDAKAILPEPRSVQKANSYQYFYVPRATTVIGGFSDGPGELRDPAGKTVHKFGDAPGYFSIPVPAGSDAKLWCFHHGNGRRLLMTVPPYLARTPKELLLPREVIERDQRIKGDDE